MIDLSKCDMNEMHSFWNFLTSGQEPERTKREYKTYIMFDPVVKVYKIGKSGNPEKRQYQLRLKNPDIITLGVLDSDIEKELLDKFKPWNLKGEWFRIPSDEVYKTLDDYDFVLLPYEAIN